MTRQSLSNFESWLQSTCTCCTRKGFCSSGASTFVDWSGHNSFCSLRSCGRVNQRLSKSTLGPLFTLRHSFWTKFLKFYRPRAGSSDGGRNWSMWKSSWSWSAISMVIPLILRQRVLCGTFHESSPENMRRKHKLSHWRRQKCKTVDPIWWNCIRKIRSRKADLLEVLEEFSPPFKAIFYFFSNSSIPGGLLQMSWIITRPWIRKWESNPSSFYWLITQQKMILLASQLGFLNTGYVVLASHQSVSLLDGTFLADFPKSHSPFSKLIQNSW